MLGLNLGFAMESFYWPKCEPKSFTKFTCTDWNDSDQIMLRWKDRADEERRRKRKFSFNWINEFHSKHAPESKQIESTTLLFRIIAMNGSLTIQISWIVEYGVFQWNLYPCRLYVWPMIYILCFHWIQKIIMKSKKGRDKERNEDKIHNTRTL